MSRLAQFQLVGPIFLLVAVAGAEGAALALGHAPGSEALWYIHLDVFGPFRWGDDLLGSRLDTAHGQLYLIALPLFLIACGGYYSRRPLALAIASNLSFVHAVVLACAGYAADPPWTATLPNSVDWGSPRVYLLAVLLGCALLSFSASHIVYLRAICQDRE
jgi:hypothetical protein